jgi:hypothetical protein
MRDGTPYACRSKPLRMETSYRDPGLYFYPNYTKGDSKTKARRYALKNRKNYARRTYNVWSKGQTRASVPNVMLYDFRGKNPTFIPVGMPAPSRPPPPPPPPPPSQRKRKRGMSPIIPRRGERATKKPLMLTYA